VKKARIRRSIAVIGALAAFTLANASPASAIPPNTAKVHVCSNGSYSTDVWTFGKWFGNVPRGKCSTIYDGIRGIELKAELFKAGGGRIGSPFDEFIQRDVWLFTGDLANGQPFWYQ
jgi:hypothetical protein